jgi:hypothetical protein
VSALPTRRARRLPPSTRHGSEDGNAASRASHRALLRLRIPPPWRKRARDKSRRGHHILCRPRGEWTVPGAMPPQRGAPCVAPRLDSSNRRKRTRSLVYLAALRLQMAADVPPTMRRSRDAGKYCHACGVPPRTGHGNANKQVRALRREKLGFSLPDWTLSAIFRGARVRNIKKYSGSGFSNVARKRSHRDREFWRFSVGLELAVLNGRCVCVRAWNRPGDFPVPLALLRATVA